MNNEHYSEEKKFWDGKGASPYLSLSPVDRQRISQWVGWKGNGRVLDIGGGSGMVSQLLAGQSNSECVCMDISLPMLKYAAVASVQADALSLPFKNGSFDLVIAAAFFHHLPGREDRLLREIYRVLRPGGRLVGYDPNAECLQNRLFMMDTPFRLSIFSPDERPIHPAFLEKQAMNAGFDGFTYRLFSFKNQKITAFEAVQRYLLSPLAFGCLQRLLDRWFFWETVKG